jgi:hypothetical protein
LVRGLLDPNADTSKTANTNITLETKPFISLDNEIIKKRINRVIKKYQGVNYEFLNGTITLSGLIKTEEQQKLIQRLKTIPGVNSINNKLAIDYSFEIQSYLQLHKSLFINLSHRVIGSHIVFTGTTTFNNLKRIRALLKQHFPHFSFDYKNVSITDSTQNLIETINSKPINIPSLSFSVPSQQLQNVISNLHLIKQRGSKISILIIGESDCNGLKSDTYSLNRAHYVKNLLMKNGFNEHSINTSIKGCKEFSHHSQPKKLNVNLKITQDK